MKIAIYGCSIKQRPTHAGMDRSHRRVASQEAMPRGEPWWRARRLSHTDLRCDGTSALTLAKTPHEVNAEIFDLADHVRMSIWIQRESQIPQGAHQLDVHSVVEQSPTKV
jgi:hypothetical protein